MDTYTFSQSAWLTDPLAAFTAFASSTEFKKTAQLPRSAECLSPASLAVYRSMFSRFVTYLRENRLSLDTVDTPAIYAFLSQTKDGQLILGSSIQYRYLRLLERVFAHIGRTPNPIANLVQRSHSDDYKLDGRNEKTVVLTQDQVIRFISALPVSTTQERTNRESAAWKKTRDRALQCMILGAGLKVSEAIALQVNEIDRMREIDGTLRINLRIAGTEGIDAKQPTFYPHITFLQADFVQEVLDWLTLRAKLPGLGSLMFPTHKGTMLKKASVYLQIRQTFTRAGISVPREGGRTLRNTFAITELENDTDLVELSDKLGLFEDRSVLVYANAIPPGRNK